MPRYAITSQGNGAFYLLTRLADMKSLVLQGDDALTFGRMLETTHDGYTDDDACDEYSDVFA